MPFHRLACLPILLVLGGLLAVGCGDDGDDSVATGSSGGSSGSGGSEDGEDGDSTGKTPVGDGSGGDGDGDSGGGSTPPPGGAVGVKPDVDTGLADSTTLSDLDADDAIALCEELNEEADAVITDEALEGFLCVSLGALAGIDLTDPASPVDVEACEAAAAECMMGEGEVTEESMCNSDEVLADLEDCGVTVEEFEACYTELLTQVADALALLTCENLADPDVAAMLETDPTSGEDVPECAVLEERCPSLAPSSDDDEGFGDGLGEPSASGCDDTCVFNNDGECDDGGPGSAFPVCGLGTDCSDCGARDPA